MHCSLQCRPLKLRSATALLCAAIALGCTGNATALEVDASGRITFGAAFRTESRDPAWLVSYNAAAIGLTGLAGSGQNTDDANLNFGRGEATTRALKAYLDLRAREGGFSALVRIKAWHDDALASHRRPWGNNPNAYAAGQPLGDSGAARLSRFSGIALSDAYIERAFGKAGAGALVRLGQQSLAWGERAPFAGGLSALNASDQSAMRRAGAVAQEMRVPSPMLFARAALSPALTAEGFYSSAFRPSALDMCGTFWAATDYLAQGCDRAFAGAMPVSDRERIASGAFLKRAPSPSRNSGDQFGVALTWKPAALGAEFGMYAARYINRTPIPGLYKSTRTGPAFIPGDPDGKNLTFFTQHADDIKLLALNASARRGRTTWSGELAYRPNQPLQLPPGDQLPAFLSLTAPSLLRADAAAVAPGAPFMGYDRYRTMQLQLGMQHDWGTLGRFGLAGSADVIAKHVRGLPDPAVRRYGRPDQMGTGPIHGVCAGSGKQCSFDGYVTPDAYAYRLRLEARLAQLAPALNATASAAFTHDIEGWSHDFFLSEGRRTMHLALRLEYRKRYVAEVAYAPNWGGKYSNQGDKDQLALAVGVIF